jgi:hypothetical protein
VLCFLRKIARLVRRSSPCSLIRSSKHAVERFDSMTLQRVSPGSTFTMRA